MTALVEVCELHYRYETARLLRASDMTLETGARCLMVGPSGLGKSTHTDLRLRPPILDPRHNPPA